MGFPCSGRIPCHACRRQYPGGTDGAPVARFLPPTSSGLPRMIGGSAPTLTVSRPARRSLALRPARSLSRLTRPVSIGVFQRESLPPLPAPTASGWSDQSPGGIRTHWNPPSLHGTLSYPVKCRRLDHSEASMGRGKKARPVLISSVNHPANPFLMTHSRRSLRHCTR